MKTLPAHLAACILLASASPAWSGEARCWLDQGVVVVSAQVAGVPGDYILDTGAPRTQLHETRAQGAGLTATAFPADVKLAGLTLKARPITVADLDARTVAFPTPIAGVLGADLLAGLILDVDFAACSVGLYPRRGAPRFRTDAALPLKRVEGVLAAPAIATDGRRLAAGDFVLATDSPSALRLDRALVQPGGAPEAHRRMRALSFAGDLRENLPTELGAGGAEASLGVPVLAPYRLRFDLVRGRLSLSRQKGPPGRTSEPAH